MNQNTNTDIVPFGKYRDQPVELMLADQNYLQWVMSQPGLVTMIQNRYPALFNIITIAGPATEDTPEHNKMQAMFLCRDFQCAFFQAVTGKCPEVIAGKLADQVLEKAKSKLDQVKSVIAAKLQTALESQSEATRKVSEGTDSFSKDWRIEAKERADKHVEKTRQAYNHITERALIKPDAPEVVVNLNFECGFDLEFNADLSIEMAGLSRVTDDHYGKIEDDYTACASASYLFYIELKPQMGDDFSSVLRQVKRQCQAPEVRVRMARMTHDYRRNEIGFVLVVGSFESAACTLDQVRTMFSPIKIITMAEIDDIRTMRAVGASPAT